MAFDRLSARLLWFVALTIALAGPAWAGPRGYLVTPHELVAIGTRAAAGVEPHASNVEAVLERARDDWSYTPRRHETCSDADSPAWNDNGGGTRTLVAKAFAYHLTGDDAYARDVQRALERVMAGVDTISLDDAQCRLNFGWGTPELVIAADLIEEYWQDRRCEGPETTRYGDASKSTGPCKARFQNWLVKNPYYVASYAGRHSASNWGAAATNTMAYVADYLADRPDAVLVHRNPSQENDGRDASLSPAEAYAAANRLALDRMNGYRVEYGSKYSCGLFDASSQDARYAPVKSQITENGIIPEDARRSQSCNVPVYDGEYQNYPQLHIGHNVQQCELMRRRGDTSCFDNVDETDIPDFAFTDRRGRAKTTHLRPGRGSLERAIKAVIVDSDTEWRHVAALNVAYRYYVAKPRLAGIERWRPYLDDRPDDCAQDVCFGSLTHGLAEGEAGDAAGVELPAEGAPAPPAPTGEANGAAEGRAETALSAPGRPYLVER